MTDNTTRVIKLANGESIVCTCIPTRIDEGSPTLEYVTALSSNNKEKEMVQEEISEEDLDNMITSNDTKH